jgi:hypothetical protein
MWGFTYFRAVTVSFTVQMETTVFTEKSLSIQQNYTRLIPENSNICNPARAVAPFIFSSEH